MSFSKILALTGVDFAIQWGCWAIAALLKTEKFYDLAGSSKFALLSLLAYNKYSNGHPRAKIQTTAILIWALRLGTYLFSRILKDGHDRRFDKARDNPSLFFFYWTMQGVWVIVTLLPSLMMVILSQKKQPSLSAQDYLGWTMWVVGFVTETLADYQKSQFRSNPANQNMFISTGVWSISRHPNYFGEILLWFGLFVSASTSFTNWGQYLSILSPTFVAMLITRMSGIPLLEAHGMKKWGHLPEYQHYIKNTPELIPFL